MFDFMPHILYNIKIRALGWLFHSMLITFSHLSFNTCALFTAILSSWNTYYHLGMTCNNLPNKVINDYNIFFALILIFSQFSGCWLILTVYILMSFDCKIVRSSVILLLPLTTVNNCQSSYTFMGYLDPDHQIYTTTMTWIQAWWSPFFPGRSPNKYTIVHSLFYLAFITINHHLPEIISLEMPVPSQVHYVFTVFRLLTDFVCLYTYEFWLSLWKIVRSSVILLSPIFTVLCV